MHSSDEFSILSQSLSSILHHLDNILISRYLLIFYVVEMSLG